MNAKAGNGAMDCLVVDDDAVGRRLAGLLLKRLGYPSPILSGTVPEAPADLQGLILIATDDTAESVAALKSRIDPARPLTRLVAMITSGSETVRQACLQAGADAVLMKPLALRDLAAALTPSGEAGDFNAEAWSELRQLFGPDGAAKLVGALIDDLPVQQQRIADALSARDLPALKRIAHALRGVSLQIGAGALAALCADTEAAATEGRTEAAAALGASLIQRHAALVERLRDETTRH
ncbi:response regulator [Solimonas sp. K1W22B-7]|uniref:Hpt domain-containing protein n=1 Tax=Solimonas sp. K1W22B-7 TaxID=2303331 RepID=UPI000E32F0EC|nr:Hpt domain-containing protein [Solimonas sp. K1W22B-7]AXQ31723.1 response regulator [Solimonas sp. K1W22B-7]